MDGRNDFYFGEALVEVNGRPHKAMADQVTTVSKIRFIRQLGELSESDMAAVIQVIKVQMGL